MAAKDHPQPRSLTRTRAPFSIRYAPQVLEKNGSAIHGTVGRVEGAKRAEALPAINDETRPPGIRAVAQERSANCIDHGISHRLHRNSGAAPSLHGGPESGHEADQAKGPRVPQTPAIRPQRREVNGDAANRKALIRLLKSPGWLVAAQRMNSYKPERMLTKIINAMNGLVDIIRRLELVERQLMNLPFASEYEQQHATFLSKALLSRWQELGEAVACFDVDSQRALYMVRHSSLEMVDVVHDVQELLRREPQPDTERPPEASMSNSIIPKSSLSSQAYSAYKALEPELIEIGRAIDVVHGRLENLDSHMPVRREFGIRRRKTVAALPFQSASTPGNAAHAQRLLKKSSRDAFARLGGPTSLICETVRELCRGLQEAGVSDRPILEALANCADRLGSIMPGDPVRKWETQLHRGRHWFMIANVKLQALNAHATSDKSAKTLLAEKAKIAQYVSESFVNVINIALDLVEGSGTKQKLRQATGTRTHESPSVAVRPTVRWRLGAEILKGPQSVAPSPRVAPRFAVGARLREGPPAQPSALSEAERQPHGAISTAQDSALGADAIAGKATKRMTASRNSRATNSFLKTNEMVSYYNELARRASIAPNT